jgi:hypothetical protein
MNSRRRFVAACTLAVSVVAACNSVDRSSFEGSAGSAGTDLSGGTDAGGTDAGGTDAGGSGTGAAAGQVSGGGRAGSSGGGSGASSSAGKGAGGGASGGATATGGAAGTGLQEAGAGGADSAGGEAGAPSTPPGPLLKNGSFELGGLAGWQIVVTPVSVGKAIFAQWPNSAGQSIDGMYELSFWNGTSAFTGDIHQTVTGLKPGKYELKLYIAYGSGINSAYLYAMNCGPSLVQVDIPVATSVPSFAPTSIPLIDVTGDTCTVGLFADMNTGDWLNADAFVFDMLPTQ